MISRQNTISERSFSVCHIDRANVRKRASQNQQRVNSSWHRSVENLKYRELKVVKYGSFAQVL